MPPTKTQHIAHVIAGGWQTDFSNMAYGSPQGGQMRIPFLTQAENLLYTLEGGIEKWPGTGVWNNTPLVDVYLGVSHVKMITDYWRQNSSQRMVTAVGASYFNTSSQGVNTLIGTTLSAVPTNVTDASVFNDLLILASEGNIAPNSWDQTTFQSLAGTPPNFAFSIPHRGRQWAAGASGAPSRLYYSAVGNPEDWVGAGSGSIDIDPGDGDGIVGITSWKQELWVFKGPNRLSIHRITGSAAADFARVPFVYGISAAGQHSIFSYGTDIGFWSPRGSCHSLTATDTYGDYVQGYINYPLLKWFRDPQHVSKSYPQAWQAVTNANAGYTIFNFTNRNADFGINNDAVVMDWRFISQGEPYPRFSRLTYYPFTSVGLLLDGGSLNPHFGDNRGGIYRTRVENIPGTGTGANYAHQAPSSNTSVIPLRCQTPYLTYGSDLNTKNISNLSLTLSTAHISNVTVKWGGSTQPKQSTTIAQPGYTPLGSFVLGTDCLGELGSQPAYSDELNGDFKSIQYNIIEDSAITADGGAGIQMTTFGVTLTPSGEDKVNV